MSRRKTSTSCSCRASPLIGAAIVWDKAVAFTIGIAFDEQVVDEVPHEATDCRVDYIVTPTRVITAEK